ncbi:MAG: MFS transporter [Dermatophilus congolensis]|nr:MFS transporter [Dermatophilus congolensis]
MTRFRGILADTRPLQNPHYRRLFWANVVTVIGAQLTIVSVPAQIYADTGSSGYVGLTGLFGLVPLVVFGLYGGSLADRFDKRRLLVVTTWGLIVTSGLFAAQAFAGSTNVWLLLGLFSLQQAFFAVNQPTRTAVLPAILPPERLPAANALNMTVMNGGGIAGPLIAGALIPFTGFAWLYTVDTITLFATLGAVLALPALPPHTDPDHAGDPDRHEARQGSVWEGLRYLAGHPVLLMSFVVDLIAMIFGMPRALFPELAHTAFAGPQEGGLAFALLFAAIPAGSVLGGVFSGWVGRVERQGRVIVLAIMAWGVAVTVFGVAAGMAASTPGDAARALPWLMVGVFALAFGGAADIASAALRQTMLQSAATPAVRGRLQGVFIVVVVGGPRIADVVHGGAADLLDRTALSATAAAMSGAVLATTIGGVLVVVGVAVAALWGRSFWRYRPQPHGERLG